MIKVFLSLGSNLGNKWTNLQKAINEIDENIGSVIIQSGIYETEAWGFESKDHFLNQVIVVMTELEPLELIDCCLDIEKTMGRKRNDYRKYVSRIIDIDILFYGEEILKEENLQIPHPLIQKRRFILEPMNEIAPDLIHPLLGKSISVLREECTDTGQVKLVER